MLCRLVNISICNMLFRFDPMAQMVAVMCSLHGRMGSARSNGCRCLGVRVDRSDPLAPKVGASPNSMHDRGGSYYDFSPRGRAESAQSTGVC